MDGQPRRYRSACPISEKAPGTLYYPPSADRGNADTHFEIKKSVENGVTATKIRKLTEKDEVDELARLLGGAEITEKVRENAEEMKRLAEETKNHRAVLQTADESAE